MRIVSLNAWGGRVWDPMIPFLAEVDADVLCLQEVVRTPGAGRRWLTYRGDGAELPQRANLYDEIRDAHPGHDAGFYPAAGGELFDGDAVFRSEFGLATFVRNSLPVVGTALGFVHGDFSLDSWGEHPRPRNAHCVRLFDTAGGAPIVVAQLHGLRELSGKQDTPHRRTQAEELVRLIRAVWRPGERLVVCGDLNLLPGSETFAILGALGLGDLVTGRGFTDTRTSYYAKDNRYADYLLVTPNVDVRRFEVIATPEVSDHRPLLLDVA